MRFRKDLVIKKIVGVDVIIPIGQALADGVVSGGIDGEELYLCEALLKEDISEEKLIEIFLIKYQVTVEYARQNIKNFLEECRKLKYLVED